MNKSRNQNVFSTLSGHNEIHLLALFGPFYRPNRQISVPFYTFPLVKSQTPHRMRRRKTLTPRFTDFEKKIRRFCGLQLSRNISTPPRLSPDPLATPARGFVNALLE